MPEQFLRDVSTVDLSDRWYVASASIAALDDTIVITKTDECDAMDCDEALVLAATLVWMSYPRSTLEEVKSRFDEIYRRMISN